MAATSQASFVPGFEPLREAFEQRLYGFLLVSLCLHPVADYLLFRTHMFDETLYTLRQIGQGGGCVARSCASREFR